MRAKFVIGSLFVGAFAIALVVLLVTFTGAGPAAPQSPPEAGPPLTPEVRWVGALRKVMHDGDLRGYADLTEIGRLPHLYAVGPVEGLRGEVTVWDGTPYVAEVRDGRLAVGTAAPPRACFLVYAQVEQWRELAIPDTVRSADDLETFVPRMASECGLPADRPFAFLLRGRPESVQGHVVNKTDDAPHDHESHERVKVHFAVGGEPVKVLGFYSDRHQGVFTCGGNLHMHVITDDGKQSGHIDELTLGAGSKLYLPKLR